MMKLYALKYQQSYLKITGPEGYLCVEMEKASVYPKEKLPDLQEHLKMAEKSGLAGVRIVELVVTENEDFVI